MRGVRGPDDPKEKRIEPTLPKASLERAHQSPPEDKMIGKVLMGRYKLIELIGQGGMGNVYLAEDTKLVKKVAVKVLPDYFGKKSSVAERFVQEALLAPSIDHENIIDVTDRGKTSEGVPFFVMEYLKGADLGMVLAREGPMHWCDRTKDILLQICRGLGAAHDKGIVHRDMKPENVFLVDRSDNREFVKLFDFGIAKILESARDAPEDSVVARLPEERTGKTQAGSVMGTPQYMAPEQASAGEIDQRADIYAVGTIMYEMFCGTVPFTLEAKENPLSDAMRVLEMQRSMPPTPPRILRPALGIPAEIEGIIMKALSKNRDERFATMKEMEDAISSIPLPEQQRRASGFGLAAIKDLRMSSRSMIGHMAVEKAETARQKRKRWTVAIAALMAGGAIGGAVLTEELYHAHKAPPAAVQEVTSPATDAGSGNDGNIQDSGYWKK